MAQTRNTTDNKQDKSSFRTLGENIWEWLKRNFWLVMAVLVLGVVLSAQQEVLTDLAKRQFVLLQRSPLGILFLLAALGAVIVGIATKIAERCKHQSTADPRSVFFALILLGLGLYVFIAFPFWQLHRWQTIVTTVTFYLIVLGSTALWLVLPGFYFNKNRQKYIDQKAKSAEGHEKSFLILDTPIDKDNEDLAVEPSYIDQLKKLIDSFPFDHTGTIAVTGAWGAGKTSHINVLESMLDKEQYLFVRFEPMKCERPELIQAAFFDQLEAALSPFRSGFPRYFRHYKELIGAVDNKYAQFVTTLFSISQEDARGRIQRGIQSLHRRIVVFIDDVDRLDRQELEQVFRLVGFNAKFSSLVFLLAMDKTKVEATMGDNDNYSDKFAEVEFYLPRLEINAIVEFVIKHIQISGISPYVMDAIANALTGSVVDIVRHCLPTMRDAKRFVNSFLLRLILMDKSNEYIFRDYFLLSLLHYADPEAFDVLAQNESFVTAFMGKGLTIKRSHLHDTKTESDDILWHLVQTLFPIKGDIQVDGDRHGINDNDYIFIYFNEVYRSGPSTSQTSGQTPQSPQQGAGPSPSQQPTQTGGQTSQSPQQGAGSSPSQQPPQGTGSNQSPQKPSNLNEFSIANMQYLLSLPKYDDMVKLIVSWRKDSALYANVKKYFKEYQIDNLSDDDPRVGKYFIVCDILKIEELIFSEGLARVEKGRKWGFIDKDGTVKIPFEYENALRFSEGLAKVKKGGKWGYVDKTGKVKIPCEYDYVGSFFEGLALVKKGGKYGYVDKAGVVKVPCEYDDIGSFSEGLALVKKGGKWGYIDEDGAVKIPFEYDGAGSFTEEGLAAVAKGGRCGFVDKTGEVQIPFEYDDAEWFSEGLAAVKIGGRWGFVDKAGAVKIPFEYIFAKPFSEGLAVVWKGGEYGFIDKTGAEKIPLEYEGAKWWFSEGLAAVKKGGKWGFVDETGAVKIPFEYDNAWSFTKDGLARVKKGGRWGYIDKAGTVKVPIEYDDAFDFYKGRARVEKDGEVFYINKEGKRVR